MKFVSFDIKPCSFQLKTSATPTAQLQCCTVVYNLELGAYEEAKSNKKWKKKRLAESLTFQ